MKMVTMYRNEREDGGITVSFTPSDNAEITYRLIADDGKMLRSTITGEVGYVFDTDSEEEYEEIPDPEAGEDTEYVQAAKILFGEEN